MNKDLDYTKVSLSTVEDVLKLSVPNTLVECLNALYYNKMEYIISNNFRDNTIEIYVKNFMLEFRVAEEIVILKQVYSWKEWAKEDPTPLATKIVEILNSMKKEILSNSECIDIQFYADNTMMCSVDGLDKLDFSLPTITIYTSQKSVNLDGEEGSVESNLTLDLIPVIDTKLTFSYDYFNNAGLCRDAQKMILQIVSDFTGRKVLITGLYGEIILSPIAKEDARAKYYDNIMKSSNKF